MQWFIIGRDMHTLCTASTDLPKSLPINDRGDNYGQNIKIVNNCAVGTYKFTTDPKHEDAKYIQEGNYISFRDKYGKDRLYTIMSVDGDTSWEVSCEDIGLDLVNEYAVPWEYDARSIEDTLSGVLFDTGWVIGINEVSNYKRATVFTGSSDTQLTRIGDVSRQFDAECDFVIEMKGSTVVSQKINIYKSIGEDKTSQRFIDNINLIALRRSGNIDDLITCVRCYGRADENGNKLTIKDIAYDDKRYYSPKGDIRIYDREARNKWSRFRAYNYEGQSEFAGYINGEFEYDTDDPQELFNRALSNLKERNEVKMEYEASLYDLQADIGDTIQIADNRNQEKIYLSARVQEVRNHYSSVGEDTGVLANYKKLQSTPASDVTEIMDQIKDQIVGIKTTEVTYAVSYSGVDIPTEGWVEDPPQTEPGQYLWTRTLTVYTNNSRTLSYSVSRNGADGKPGADGTSVTILGSYASEEELIQAHPTGDKGDAYIVNGDLYVWNGTSWENVGKIQGPQGTPGLPGEDGRTPYVHIKYSNDGGSTFTGNNGEDPGDWLGQYTDFELNDSTNPGDYKWSKIKGDKGEKGDQGLQGLQGEKGDQGLPGKDGIDGKTSYTHIAYANSADGSQDFSISDPNRDYIGMYVNFTQTDSNDYRDYAWSKIKGADGSQGIPGKPGEDGKTPYLHIAYANSADGSIEFSTTDSTDKLYIGQYTNYISSDSEDPSDYAWTRIKGDKGDPGIQGPAGENGKTTYFHVKYSANANGYPMSETPNVYIGTYVDFEPLDSNDYRDYTWSRFRGTDGIPGVNGADGRTSYLHIKYSNDGGSTFTGNNGEDVGDWMGQYVDFVSTDSNNPRDYKWSQIKGDTGTDGKPGTDGEDGKMLYATSNTEADNPNKVALLKEGEFSLYIGATVTVRFANENIAERPKLNINNTGSKSILTQGLPSAYWMEGASVVFVYDGTYWQVASTPVYASKATIGNPLGNHVYLEDAVYLKKGSIALAKFTGEKVLFTNGGELWVASGQIAMNFPTESGRKLGFTAYRADGQKDRVIIQGDELIVRSVRADMTTTVNSHLGLRKDYEYDEYYTGDIWLGKEIYQKLIHVGALNNTMKTIAHGIANVDKIWVDLSNSFLLASSGITYTIPRVSNQHLNQTVPVRVDKTKLYVDAGANASFSDCYVTLRYTKTK